MRWILLSVAALTLLSLGFVPPREASGDEGYAVPEAWVFDARVVRVVTTTPDVTEAPGAWEPTTGTTIRTPWGEVLTALKERGATTLLLDQRITTVRGRSGQASEKSDRVIEQFSNRDLTNERYASSTLSTGTQIEVTPEADGLLTYRVQVQWDTPSDSTDRGAVRPRTSIAQFAGVHPLLDGSTLVLRYRGQVGENAPVGVEVFVLLTGQRVP